MSLYIIIIFLLLIFIIFFSMTLSLYKFLLLNNEFSATDLLHLLEDSLAEEDDLSEEDDSEASV